MIEMIVTGLVAGVGVFGHVKARDFVRRRLRFTKFVKKPMRLGVGAGLATLAVAMPAVALLPAVGAGTAIFFGFAVGAGTGLGARDVQGNKALPRMDD